MATIYHGDFNDSYPDSIAKKKKIADWPVVYVLNNDNEAYIGETVNMQNRSEQHLKNPDKQRMTKVHVITDDTFNKSVILDLESFLIKYAASDKKYDLLNGNGGVSNHNYYDKKHYEDQFDEIWEQLRKQKLARHTIDEIEASDLFKYSPYKALSPDQYRAMTSILVGLYMEELQGRSSCTVVQGGPGTGKTVLAVYLLKLLADNNTNGQFDIEMDEAPEEFIEKHENLSATFKGMKIGMVVPMQALRKTISGVADHIRNLDKSMILKPTDVVNEKYDLLIVDEAHRLHRRKALSQYPKHDSINEALDLGKDGTELDWILACSKHQILFYDRNQSVRPSDIQPQDIEALLKSSSEERVVSQYSLETQFRCKAGDAYIRYIGRILSNDPPESRESFEGYDFRLFNDPNDLITSIKALEDKEKLCRTVAGYAWEWKSKKDKKAYDFDFNGKQYRWNSTLLDWVNSDKAIDEIGCIHTIQGYDLNYAGVIIGPDVYYDKVTREIKISQKDYKDSLGRTVDGDMELLRRQILNVYYTLLTRGTKGTYVYACDDALREYLSKYIP